MLGGGANAGGIPTGKLLGMKLGGGWVIWLPGSDWLLGKLVLLGIFALPGRFLLPGRSKGLLGS